jgi:sec-independent protein translocase protein TatA
MAAFLAFIGLPGPTEMVIVLFIILILFGSRLPSLMRNLGRSAVEFKKGVQGVDDDGDPDPQHDAKGR